MFVPVNEPKLTEEDFNNLKECFQSGWISSAGKYLEKFENDWASYCGMAAGIGVANGTVALEIAVQALGIGAGDEVILPSFTIISCAGAIVKAGAKPVVVDVDPEVFQMNVEQIESKINSKTKAIMVVHMYGHPTDMDAVLKLAEKYNLKVIEDAAEVHGAEYLRNRNSANPQWQRCGGMGDISTFSFFANKLITTGEGGMILAKDSVLAERCRSLRNLCFVPERRFLHYELGHQVRMTNMQAAVGWGQIGRMPQIIQRKREIAAIYDKAFADIKAFVTPKEMKWAKSVFWIYGLVLNDSFPLDAVQFANELKKEGVETRPFFLGMHEQPVFHKMGLFLNESYPVSERIARRGFYIPAGLGTSEEQIQFVISKVRKVVSSVQQN